MTEKRFIKYNNSVSQFEDTKHKDLYSIYDGVESIIQLLNKLNNENEELKKENKELQQYLCWQDMELEEMEDIKR